MLFPVLLFIGGVLSLIKITAPKQKVEKKQKDIEEMDKDLGGYSHQFGQMCIAG